MIIYFADRQLNILGQASTGLPEGLSVISDTKTEDVETGVATFECTLPFDRETRRTVENCTEVGNYLLRSHNGETELYTIIEEEIDTKKQQVYLYAEDDGMDLLNETAGPYEASQAYPIEHYIEMYALNAGFEIGINEAKNLTRRLSWDGEATASERIASVATQFGGFEISFSFEVEGLVVSKKYINIYKTRGKDVGTVLRLNEDIDSIVLTKSIANLATALLCTGGTPEDDNYDDDAEPMPITLSGYEYDDGDIYIDGELLKSRKALQRWSRVLWQSTNEVQNGGHIVKRYAVDTLSQQELCASAVAELKRVGDIEATYDVVISSLPDDVKIGDRVNVVDSAGKLYVSARVLRLKTSVSEGECKATLGDYVQRTGGVTAVVPNAIVPDTPPHDGVNSDMNSVLWGDNVETGMLMTDEDTVLLSRNISSQRTGIVLVFCASAESDGWQSFFIPKQLVALRPGARHMFELHGTGSNAKGYKSVCVGDGSITGHADNCAVGTLNGIPYANNQFVLRYVIGV